MTEKLKTVRRRRKAAPGPVEIREMRLEDLPAVFALGQKLFTAEDLPTLYLCWDDDEVMQSMKLEQQGRCQSCGVELGRSKKTFPHIAVIVRGKERKRILICGLCFEGFHTRSLSRTFGPSTQ